MSKKEAKKGFTLIELLVVVLIIGILASVALPQYNLAVEKSRATEAWVILKSINDAQKARNLEMDTKDVVYPLEELGLSFVNNDGTPATGNSLSTKDFFFHHEDGTSGFFADRGKYHLIIDPNGKRECGPSYDNDYWEKACKAIMSNSNKKSTCISGNTCFTD